MCQPNCSPANSAVLKVGAFSDWRQWSVRGLALFLLVITGSARSWSYSVLTHEEIVDLLWADDIRPLLLKRFPGLTDDQIKEAHAYAYGGAVIQDLGYYPFGSKEFSDLSHYVRSGDFVVEMVRESADADEFAFALGALAHYASDITGHPMAVNQAVAIEYPKLRAKYGKSVTYAENKTAHLKTEFGFDVLQVAKNRYASQQYHDFIGFQVSKPLLERVFPVIYGVQLKDVLPHEDLAIGSYRFSVSRVIPQMTRVALQAHKKDLIREHPDFAKKTFLYHLSRSSYEKEWGKDYTKPGIGARILGVVFRIIPKVGPFKGLGPNNPTPQTEDLYFKSIDSTVDRYRAYLHAVRSNSLQLPDQDLDTGQPAKAGEYSLADETYAKLLEQLSKGQFGETSPELRANIISFYSSVPPPVVAKAAKKKDESDRQEVTTALEQLKSFSPATGVAPH
jgi:hypothetical protein